MSATRPTFGALQFATSYAANLLLAHGDGASSDTIEWLHNNLRALLDAYDAAASSSSTPLSETPSGLKSNERIARHPNGHLMVEVLPWAPSEADEEKALDSLAKAYPYLEKHASHIDGEFDLALTNVRMMLARMRRSIADLEAMAPPRAHDCGFSASLARLSTTPSEVRCSGCGIVAKQIAQPETLLGHEHYCGGTWRRSSLAPLSEPTSEGK